MKITAEELRAGYRNMSDEELLSLDREDLTEVALKIHDEELQRRGLTLQAELEDVAEEDPLVALERFDVLEQARTAESVLRSANIFAEVENDTVRRMGFQLMVPASAVEDAREILKAAATVGEADAIILNARYENGVFVPVQEVEIREGAVVEIRVSQSDFLG